MAIKMYHPNKAVKGFAASFWHSHKHDSVFATLIKQSGWDSVNQNGTFKESMDDPTKKVNVKLSYVEVAGILDCIDRGRPFSKFHDTEESTKGISFSPWVMDQVQKGFSFSITVTNKEQPSVKNSFYIGLTYEEARLIREFLIFTLHHFHFPLITSKKEFNSLEMTESPITDNTANDAPVDPLSDL